jgi:hypothetical protein
METPVSAVQVHDNRESGIVASQGGVYCSLTPAQLTPPSNGLGVNEHSDFPSPGGVSDETFPTLEDRADVELLVERITTVGERIADAFAETASEDLRNRVGEWADLHGFDELDDTVQATSIARQAALAVLLRVTLYESRHEIELSPTAAEDVLRDAASEEPNSVVEWNVIDDIAWLADAPDLAPAVNASQELLQTTAPSDDLGELYAKSVDAAARQTLSQFRTPRWAGRAMRTWAVNDGETLLDIGIGPAALSTPFHPSWQLYPEPRDVIGIDRSRLSLLLGETALTLSNQPHSLVEADLLDTVAADLPGSPDGLITNPPYTGAHRLADADKNRWCKQASQEAGVDISKKSPLYVYFMIHAETLVDDGDRVAFLTPQSWLQKQYGHDLKQFLKDRFDIKALIQVNPDRGSLFPGADTTAVFTLLEARSDPDPASKTRFITIDDMEFSTLHKAMHSTATDDTDWAMINTVEQSALTDTENWQARFDPIETDVSHLPELSDVASVHTIRPTGASKMFCLTSETVEEYDISTQHLSRLLRRPKQVTGYIYRDSDWAAARDAGKEVWLLDPDEITTIPDTVDAFAQQYDNGELVADGTTSVQATLSQQYDAEALTTDATVSEHENLFRYLRDSIREHDLRDNGTLADRSLWYRPKRHEAAPVLVNNAAQDQPQFILNEAELRTTNSFFEVKIGLAGEEKKALLAYLNSSLVGEVAEQYSGTRSGGMDKMSVKTTEQLPVIDPRTLPESEVRALADAFDELCDTAQDRSCSEVMDCIDTIVNRVVERTRPD